MIFLRKKRIRTWKKYRDINTTCLLVQKYANDRAASLFQACFEIYLGFRWWSIHRIILRCKVVGQPSSIIPILIHPLYLDQWDFLIIISHDLHSPRLQVETFTSHPGTEPFASDSDVTCGLLLLLIAAARSGGASGSLNRPLLWPLVRYCSRFRS
jgi:hypothetical protein